MTDKPVRKLCIIASKASLDMAYPPLILANAARMSGIEVDIFFTFWGLDVIRTETMDKLHVSTVGNPGMHIPTWVGGAPGLEAFATAQMNKQIAELDFPMVSEFLEILSASGVRLFACRMSVDMMHLEEEDFYEDVEIIGAMEFMEYSEGAQLLFI